MTPKQQEALASYAAALTLAVGSLVVAVADDPDTCARVRAQVQADTEVLDAASASGVLTLADRTAVTRERSILAAALKKCSPTSTLSPSAPSPSGPRSMTPGPASSGSPVPSPSATIGPVPAAWPNADNTGVPKGTILTTYTGPCTITTANTVIDKKAVACDLTIATTGVIIKNSKIEGQIGSTEESKFSFTLQDSQVDAGIVQGAAVGTTNMTILRANIHGGATSVYCYANCTIRDSYLHGQRLPEGVDWHLGAFLANDNGLDPGGRTNALLVHNTIVCDTKPNSYDGGCSGDINLYGDFGPISYVTFDSNLFGANDGISYCFYGGDSGDKPFPVADHVVVTNNVFQRGTNGKCGDYGPVTAFNTGGVGNLWSNNRWDDGAEVRP